MMSFETDRMARLCAGAPSAITPVVPAMMGFQADRYPAVSFQLTASQRARFLKPSRRSKGQGSAPQLNTKDLPEVETRAPRTKSRHWAMRSGPRHIAIPDAGKLNDWCRRTELQSAAPGIDGGSGWVAKKSAGYPFNNELAAVPENDEVFADHPETNWFSSRCGSRFVLEKVPDGMELDLGAFLSHPDSLSPTKTKRGSRSRGKTSSLSSSWVWTEKSKTKTQEEEKGEDEKVEKEKSPEEHWPALRPAAGGARQPDASSECGESWVMEQDAGSECAESWEVCSNVSSVASSWAMLEGGGEQPQQHHGLALTREGDDVKAAPIQQRQQLNEGSLDDVAAATTITSPNKSSTITPVLDEASSTKEAAPMTEQENVAKDDAAPAATTSTTSPGNSATTMSVLEEAAAIMAVIRQLDNLEKEEQELAKAPAEKRKTPKRIPVKTMKKSKKKNEEEDSWDTWGAAAPGTFLGPPVEKNEEEKSWNNDAVPAKKDEFGDGRWTKGGKASRSVKQQEKVAKSCARREAERTKARS